ncbi:MAG: hypothetical protein K9M45_03130 [Kiritimatiellales bacterium]|nr:hypothetical protein [Kiritimatiellales bacterium]
MKKQLPIILLVAVCAGLGFWIYSSKQDTNRLKDEVARLKDVPTELAMKKADGQSKEKQSVSADPVVAANPLAEEPPSETNKKPKPDSAQRMMRSISKMLDNPTMNKVMEASQRGALGALYENLLNDLGLNESEKQYFMELLMFRQMKNVELGMKMMSGGLSKEEQQAMTKDLKETADLVKEEMEYFLNSPEDVAEWEFYEKTMGERMMLSQVDQKLAGLDAPLSEDTYRKLLEMMHEEKKNFDFTSNLHDEKNMDMSPNRFSQENIQSFSSDVEQLNANISDKARGILTQQQFDAFSESMKASTEMQQAQLEMAAQMFGGKQE